MCVCILSACPVGTFSDSVGNEPCVVCPPNSEATQTGLTECTCVPDYYRATDDGPSVACTRELSHHFQASLFSLLFSVPLPLPCFSGLRVSINSNSIAVYEQIKLLLFIVIFTVRVYTPVQ